jgi:hypothetical protein
MDLTTATEVVRTELTELGIYGPDDAFNVQDLDALKVRIWNRQRYLDTLNTAMTVVLASVSVRQTY